MIGVVGSGIVAGRIGEVSRSAGTDVVALDGSSRNGATGCAVVIVATGGPQFPLASALLHSGSDVVCTADALEDVIDLLELDREAKNLGRRVLVGAAASPGLTGLLARYLARSLDSVDEVHVAAHGTGGPACARQHHRALAGESIGWHDGEWLRRPGGSGRELCWFPDPIGAYDCYRSEMADPVLLRRAMPELSRVTARMSATRRDRFTSRLPMLTPPNAEGGLGALRVEVRGFRAGSRVVEVVGVVERLGQIAATMAWVAADALRSDSTIAAGCHVFGHPSLPNERLLADVLAAGIRVEEFVNS